MSQKKLPLCIVRNARQLYDTGDQPRPEHSMPGVPERGSGLIVHRSRYIRKSYQRPTADSRQAQL